MSPPLTAALWHPIEDGFVRCDLCHHRCRIAPGERGSCCVRENRSGTLVSLATERLVSASVDPIEKKPLFHFHPGSTSLSVATMGCNLACVFCQNWSISQWPRSHPDEDFPGERVVPAEIAEAARARGCASISFTYTEPTVFWELVREIAREGHTRRVKNVLVTNGYMTDEALDYLGDLVDAANVDLKGLDPARHQAATGARPEPVRSNIRRLRERGVWVEVTTLIVPGLNDGEEELRGIARFLASVDPDLPWHVSRFHPDYQWTDRPATSPHLVREACTWGREEGLRYVYPGNLRGDDHESTFCPACGARVIERRGFTLGAVAVAQGRCVACQTPIPGVGLP